MPITLEQVLYNLHDIEFAYIPLQGVSIDLNLACCPVGFSSHHTIAGSIFLTIESKGYHDLLDLIYVNTHTPHVTGHQLFDSSCPFRKY
jgi:hypothetical protein